MRSTWVDHNTIIWSIFIYIIYIYFIIITCKNIFFYLICNKHSDWVIFFDQPSYFVYLNMMLKLMLTVSTLITKPFVEYHEYYTKKNSQTEREQLYYSEITLQQHKTSILRVLHDNTKSHTRRNFC